ncbi:hypothetical protein MKW92_016204 [Papaver armeniacum]|nr:hypothetical protein MKW92_016204 [Papaver armeniacum]
MADPWGIQDRNDRLVDRLNEMRDYSELADSIYGPAFDIVILQGDDDDIMDQKEEEDVTSHLKKISVLDDAENCSICLHQYMNGGDDDAVVLKCWHVFHERCILEWSKRKPNCPVCRHDMRKEKLQSQT